MIGREGPGPERPGPDYPPEYDAEPEEQDRCTCSTWWVDTDPSSGTYGEEYDQGGGERERRYSRDPDCPVHGEATPEPVCGQAEGPHFTGCYSPDPWAAQGPVPPPPF